MIEFLTWWTETWWRVAFALFAVGMVDNMLGNVCLAVKNLFVRTIKVKKVRKVKPDEHNTL